MITFPAAPALAVPHIAAAVPAPSQTHTRGIVETLAHAGSKAVPDCASVAGLFTQKSSPKRLTAPGSEERAMHTPFGPYDTTDADSASVFLCRSTHPGYFDLPFVTEEVLRRGQHEFGKAIAVDQLEIDEIVDLDKALTAYEAQIRKAVVALREDIERRALFLSGQLPFDGVAA